ncbi:amidohydrolase family protein [Actinomadura livida]|uniref:Amidohydrolase family protein n=1 Tax=Actinomadura livida TaxID=79909 RepID=A0A7W7N1K6_9ACTN|nr:MULTISPECIES: amidohydrolase family protein [Actinomadura]MBB4778055.1 putative TIM-barrel fold metal-dependent hydrolase [Actinomadura catellatispora]GGT96886.1 amidohydrolase [Actinomadura livida]
MSDLTRRRTLKLAAATGVAAAAAAVPLQGRDAAASPRRPSYGRIDTHHHAVPPKMRQWAVEQGIIPPDDVPRWAQWTLEETLATMEANGIAMGVASAPVPPEIFADREAAESGVRVCNESLAELVRDNPARFGFFANVAMLHPDLALEQVAYALDELGAAGVLLTTSAGGRYLGDRTFDPLLAELDRRGAVVFTHPFAPQGIVEVPEVGEWLGDFLLDTTRTALSLIASGAMDRYRRLSVILSHGGGFLPYMAGRAERWGREDGGPDPQKFRRALRRFYYDTALPMSPYATPTLIGAVGAERVLFGTDWPANSAGEVGINTADFDRDPGLDRRAHRAISRDNALRLLPGLARHRR